MQDTMMGAAEAQLEKHLIWIADEIAIGKKQQFDDVPDGLGLPRDGSSGRRAIGGCCASSGSLCAHIYVSHVDIFWFYVTKMVLRTKGLYRNGPFRQGGEKAQIGPVRPHSYRVTT